MKGYRLVLPATLAAVLLTAIPAWAGDSEFRAVLKAVEQHYGIHHTRIPFLGLVLKFYHPEGIRGISLATFENLDGRVRVSGGDLDEIVRHNLGGNWRPLVRIISRRDNESTVIFVDASGDRVKMFIASIERDEATILKMDVSEEGLNQFLDDEGGALHSGKKKHELLAWGNHEREAK